MQAEFAIVDFPFAEDPAVDGIVFRTGRREVSNRLRTDDEMFEAGHRGIDIDAGQRLEKPRTDVAKHDVVARFRAVPLFPQGRGSLFDPPTPAWKIFL